MRWVGRPLIYSHEMIKSDSFVSEKIILGRTTDPSFCWNLQTYFNIIHTRIVEVKCSAPKPLNRVLCLCLICCLKSILASVLQSSVTAVYVLDVRRNSNAGFRSDPTCSHCGGDRHSIDVCPTVQTTDPVCLFRCKPPRLATGQNYYERAF